MKDEDLDEAQLLSRKNLLMIADLVATCALGENSGAESICCTVFSMDELIRIVSHDNISIYCKRPFMKFLVSVYLEDEGKKKAQLLRNK